MKPKKITAQMESSLKAVLDEVEYLEAKLDETREREEMLLQENKDLLMRVNELDSGPLEGGLSGQQVREIER